ncbi:MAG: hypothetical protein ACRDA3_16430 [Peptostreptococcaceae bacterium]
MLRLNRNRKQSTKGKSSNKTKSMDNVPSKQYEENYNDVILNDLVPEEKRSEFGLESETPKKNSKKSGGIKLNLGLKGKKNKKSTETSDEKVKDSSKNKSSNKENGKSKESNKSEKIESKPSKSHKESQSNADKSSGSKKKSNKTQEESKVSKGKKTSKGSNSNKGSSAGNSKKTKSSKGSKASHSSVVEHEENHDVVENESKKTPRPVVNPKRRRRQEQEQNDTTRNFDENLENEVEEIMNVNEENIDSKGFRSIEDENPVEIKEVKSKFEDLVWSEDKFPKNK